MINSVFNKMTEKDKKLKLLEVILRKAPFMDINELNNALKTLDTNLQYNIKLIGKSDLKNIKNVNNSIFSGNCTRMTKTETTVYVLMGDVRKIGHEWHDTVISDSEASDINEDEDALFYLRTTVLVTEEGHSTTIKDKRELLIYVS